MRRTKFARRRTTDPLDLFAQSTNQRKYERVHQCGYHEFEYIFEGVFAASTIQETQYLQLGSGVVYQINVASLGILVRSKLGGSDDVSFYRILRFMFFIPHLKTHMFFPLLFTGILRRTSNYNKGRKAKNKFRFV